MRRPIFASSAVLALALAACALEPGDEESGQAMSNAYAGERLTPARVAELARAAGVPCGDRLVLAVAVAWGESEGYTRATHYNAFDGSIDRGLWQINSRAWPSYGESCVFDGACNAKAMAAISNKGASWSHWLAYTNGRYQMFMSQGREGAAAACNGSSSTGSSSGGGMSATIFGTGGDDVNVRAEPTTASKILTTVAEGQAVNVLCQTKGQWVDGTDVWDRIESPSGYVNDAYVRTGVNGFHPSIKRCDGSSSSAPPSSSGSGSQTASRGFSSIWGGGAASITSDFAESNGVAMYDYGRAYGLDGIVHTGVDVGISVGTKLYAPKGGKIVCVGGAGSSPDGSACGFFGDSAGGIGRIQISLDDGSQLILGHCRSAVVSVGQRVEAGDQVGTSGSLNGPHVHVEMRVKGGGTSSGWRLVDPRTRL